MGLAVPGLVGREGQIVNAPLLGWRNHPMQTALSQVLPQTSSGISATVVDNMLSMFVSLTQLSVKPPLFFVKYIRDKVFT